MSYSHLTYSFYALPSNSDSDPAFAFDDQFHGKGHDRRSTSCFLRGNALQPAHVGSQNFKNCKPGSADCEAAAVQGVDKLVLGLGACRLVADVGPPCLKGFEIRAGRDFAVELLA